MLGLNGSSVAQTRQRFVGCGESEGFEDSAIISTTGCGNWSRHLCCVVGEYLRQCGLLYIVG